MLDRKFPHLLLQSYDRFLQRCFTHCQMSCFLLILCSSSNCLQAMITNVKLGQRSGCLGIVLVICLFFSNHAQVFFIVTVPLQLPKLINANFPTDPERMSIFGHSMGGHGALILTLKNPGKYKVRNNAAYLRYILRLTEISIEVKKENIIPSSVTALNL